MSHTTTANELFRKLAKARVPMWMTFLIFRELRRHQDAASPPWIVVEEIETILDVWKHNRPQCVKVGRSIAEQKAARTLRQMFMPAT